MTSVTRSEIIDEKGPVMSKTHDHQLESSLSPVEVFTKTSASLEMHQGVSEERIHLGCSPKKGENCDLSHQERLPLKSLHLSPQEQSASYQDRRQSWRRSSMKETNRRKSLHPIHQGITGGVLYTQDTTAPGLLLMLLAATNKFLIVQYSPARMTDIKDFFLWFSVSYPKVEQKIVGKASDFSLEASVAEMKEYITKFSLERQIWDQLLVHYQQEAEEILSRGSTEAKISEVKVEPMTYRGSSQNEVLNTKPDYQKILQNQSKVFDCMELVMDELQGSVKQLQAFMEESTQCFQKVSVQLGKLAGELIEPGRWRLQ
uniref:DSN1 component of MIS12 kinetochore complex n=1 Tax=Rhinopithecus bieti TaxID=61621 RepID=A0A2K6LJ38_RHIBE